MALETKIRRLSATRGAVMDELQSLTTDQLTARPLADKWSILDIIEHLVLAERIVLRGLPDPAALSERSRSLKQRALYFMVLLFLKARIPVRVPSRRMLPHGGRSLTELRVMWDENQSWLERYAALPDAADRGRAVFEHPVAGPLTLAQAVVLDQIHFDVHARQIRRLQHLLSRSTSS